MEITTNVSSNRRRVSTFIESPFKPMRASLHGRRILLASRGQYKPLSWPAFVKGPDGTHPLGWDDPFTFQLPPLRICSVCVMPPAEILIRARTACALPPALSV